MGLSVAVCHPEFNVNLARVFVIGLERDTESAVRQGLCLSGFQNQIPVGCGEGLFIPVPYACTPLDSGSTYRIAKRSEYFTGAFGLGSLDWRSWHPVKFEFQKISGV